jgi:hypothetical protein
MADLKAPCEECGHPIEEHGIEGCEHGLGELCGCQAWTTEIEDDAVQILDALHEERIDRLLGGEHGQK